MGRLGRLSSLRRTSKPEVPSDCTDSGKPRMISSRPMLLATRLARHRPSFSQHGNFWKRTTRSRAPSGSPFLPLLLLWITPHQLHKMHFHIKKSPLTLSVRLTREKEQRDFLEISPKGEKSLEFFLNRKKKRKTLRKNSPLLACHEGTKKQDRGSC